VRSDRLERSSAPHLLIPSSDRESQIGRIAVSPNGRWIATSEPTATRLWPMPDLSKPPLHTLPYDKLMPKLRQQTNLRVVPDRSNRSGYKVEIGPIPSWKDAPTW